MEFIDGTVIATALPDMAISFGVQAVDLNIGISTYLITLAVLRTTPKHQLITAIATLTWPVLVAPIIGPPLGGFITSYANWRWIFFINVPLGILAIVLALRFIPDIHDDERRPFDIAGFIATSVAMVSLVYAIELLGAQQPQGFWR